MDRRAGRGLNNLEYVLASGEDRSGFLAFGATPAKPHVKAP